MNLEYVPLLQVQRELYRLPRGMERFRQYLRAMSPDGATLELPSLVAMNPMGKEHVTALLDALLALDADAVAAQAVDDAMPHVAEETGEFKVSLVVVDDLKGGWTNRYATEFSYRFENRLPTTKDPHPPRWTKHFWIGGTLWSSEAATKRSVREAVLTAIFRAAYVLRHGRARTLGAMLAQEGYAMRRAGCVGPALDEEDIAYTREVLTPLLDAEDKRTAIECLFGDAAGRTLGFTPRGLSLWAGLALALHDACERRV